MGKSDLWCEPVSSQANENNRQEKEAARPATEVNAAWASMTDAEATPVENTQELRDALFHAICLLGHAKPENDADHCDAAAARELSKLRDSP